MYIDQPQPRDGKITSSVSMVGCKANPRTYAQKTWLLTLNPDARP